MHRPCPRHAHDRRHDPQSRTAQPLSAISSRLTRHADVAEFGRRARFRSVSGRPGGGSSPLIRISARSPGAPCNAKRPPETRRPFAVLLSVVAQRSFLRAWRRCAVTIEKPIASRSTPAPTVQRRSKPVNGSVEAFAVGSLVVVGVVDVGSLDASSGAVVFVGVLSAFSGEVPDVGVVAGVVAVGVVLVVVGLLL